MSKEVMKLALDMLNEIADDVYCDQKLEGVISVLRQVLVDADDTSQERVDEIVKDEQEPVAWFSTAPDGKLSNKFACKPTEGNWVEPLYTAPPKREWVGLTALEIYECWKTGDVVEAVEAKLKEKNNG